MDAKVSCIIIDFSSISYIDSSAVETIGEILETLEEKGVVCLLASCTSSVMSMFERTKFLENEKCKNFDLFPTVHDAVIWFQQNNHPI